MNKHGRLHSTNLGQSDWRPRQKTCECRVAALMYRYQQSGRPTEQVAGQSNTALDSAWRNFIARSVRSSRQGGQI